MRLFPAAGPALAGVAAAVLLSGCAAEAHDLSAGGLEDEVAALYPGAGGARVDVACAGPLAAEVGASQDCRVTVHPDPATAGASAPRAVRATVRATVRAETEDGLAFEAAPVVRASRVAREVLDGLTRDEYAVGSVVCAGDLLGTVGESVACTAIARDGGRRTLLEATVREVDGLDVRIGYRFAG